MWVIMGQYFYADKEAIMRDQRLNLSSSFEC